MDELTRLIKAGLDSFGIPSSETTLIRLRDYIELLWTWNSVFRLTAESSKADLVRNQLLDSLTVYKFLTQNGLLVDVGSGAGFPGLIVKLIHPDKMVWLVEAKAHKANFLRDVQRSLGLESLIVWEGRAEELMKEKVLASRCSECTTKAFGNIEKFLQVCVPLLCAGGSALAMVGDMRPISRELLTIYSGPVVHKIKSPFRRASRTVVQFFKTSLV